MQHQPIEAPKWTRSDETMDMSFEYAEWASDDDADLECTFHLKLSNVEVDPVNPDDCTTHVDTLEVSGAEVSERGLTTYLDREQLFKIAGYKTISRIEANLLETAIEEAA